MHRIGIFVTLLLLSGAYADFNSTNSNSTEEAVKDDRSHLLLNFISPMALGIASALIAIVAIGTGVICVFDLRGQSGLSKEARSGEGLNWIPPPVLASEKRKKKVSPRIAKPAKDSDESSKSQKDEMKLHELEAEATQFSLVRGASSRMDAHEKHARIIEAIYQASGRDLPEMYRTKNRLKVGKAEDLDNMLNPLEAIHEEDDDASGQDPTQSTKKNATLDTVEDAPEAPQKIQDLIAEKPKEAGSPKKDVVSEKDTSTKQNTDASNKESISKEVSKEDFTINADGKEEKKESKDDAKEEKKGSNEGVKEEKKGSKEEVKEDKKESKDEAKEEKKGSKEEIKPVKIEGLQKEDEKRGSKETIKEVKIEGLKKE